MPVNYAQFLAGVPSPVDRLQEGIAAGQSQQLNTQQIQQNDVILENQRADQAAAQAQAAQQSAIQGELVELSNNPNRTAKDIQDFIIRNPAYADKLKEPMAAMNDEQRQVSLNEAINVKAALSSGDTERAIQILKDRKQAAINSGDQQEADKSDIMIKTIQSSPEGAGAMIDMFIAANDPEKFVESSGKLAEQQRLQESEPLNIAKKLKDLDYTDAQIAKINFDMQAGVDKGFTTLTPAQVEAMGQPPGTIIQEDELGKYHVVNEGLVKFTAGQTEKDKKKIVQVAKDKVKANQLINIIDNMIGSEDGEIEQHPGLNAAVGAYDAETYTFLADTKSFEAYQEQLEGTAFLEAFQQLKGGGTITEAEGKKAAAAMGRMSTAQNEDDYKEALSEMRQIVRDRIDVMGVVSITGDADFNKLASGTKFIAPDGTLRTKR